jgi:cysteine desulfurase family protein
VSVKAREIYFDNAATSFPKPESVETALLHFHRDLGASAGRGAYPRAVLTGRLLEETRKLLASFFHIRTPKQIVFTLNASDALNLAIKGLDWRAGDNAVISAMEHNSVLRPLNALKNRKGIKITKIKACPEGFIRPNDLAKAINGRTRLVAVVHASNVTGSVQLIEEIGRITSRKGVPFLVDASQTAGALPIDVEAMKIDLLALPGHKALLGPLGTGALYVREGLDLETIREGGTGSLSEQEVQPEFLPDKFEPGSHNALGIAGWKAGLEFLAKETIAKVRRHEVRLMEMFFEGLKGVANVQLFGPNNPAKQVAVVSIRVGDFAPPELSHRLYERGKLMTRSGLHCAPGAHQAIGTYPLGTTRFSFGYFNTPQDIDLAVSVLGEISKKAAIAIQS